MHTCSLQLSGLLSLAVFCTAATGTAMVKLLRAPAIGGNGDDLALVRSATSESTNTLAFGKPMDHCAAHLSS